MGVIRASGELRQASPADGRRMAELHARLFSEPWDEKAWHGLLTAPTSYALCIEGPDKDVIAFIAGRVSADEAEVLSLGVTPSCRSIGLAGRLVQAFADWSRRRGVASVYLEVAEDNAAARAVYARAGFIEAGRRRGYYPSHDGTAADALVLILEL